MQDLSIINADRLLNDITDAGMPRGYKPCTGKGNCRGRVCWQGPDNVYCYGGNCGGDAKPKPDAVDQPHHYARWPMQPIEFTAINNLPWWLFSLLKYAMRYDAKNGLEDLYKARSFLNMKIRQLEGHPRWWEKPVAEERKLNGR